MWYYSKDTNKGYKGFHQGESTCTPYRHASLVAILSIE